MSDVIDKIREKYPQYSSVSDDELVERIGQRYPQYLERDPAFKADFNRVSAAKTKTETSTPLSSPPHDEEADASPAPQAQLKAPEGPRTSLYPVSAGESIPGTEKTPKEAPAGIPEGTFEAPPTPTPGQEEYAGRQLAKLSAPIAPIPRLEGNNPNVQAFLSGAMGRPVSEKEATAITALYNTGKGFAEFMESPLGIATAGVGTIGGAVLKRIVSGLFALDIGSKTPEAARKAGEASVTGTPQEKLEAGLGLATTIALPGFLAKPSLGEPASSITGATPSVEGTRVKVPVGADKGLAMMADRMSQLAPATAAATRSVAELPIPKQIEEFKKAASEELPKAPEIPSVVEASPKVPEASKPRPSPAAAVFTNLSNSELEELADFADLEVERLARGKQPSSRAALIQSLSFGNRMGVSDLNLLGRGMEDPSGLSRGARTTMKARGKVTETTPTPPEAQQATEKGTDAIPEQVANVEVLRTKEPEVGLSEVGERDQEHQESSAAQEHKTPEEQEIAITDSEKDFGKSLAKKYGGPVEPISPAKEPHEFVMRFSNMLERAADKSTDESELTQILSASKGKPDESRIAWAVANNPHSSAETFAQAKASDALRAMTTDENIASLDARRAELRKQRKLPSETHEAPVPLRTPDVGAKGAEETKTTKEVKWSVTQDGEPQGIFTNERQARMFASGLSGKVKVSEVDMDQPIPLEPKPTAEIVPFPKELTKGKFPEKLPPVAPETITGGSATGTQERTGSEILAEADKTARSAATKLKRESRSEKDRPWDLIDHIESALGGKISLKKARELISDFKPVGAARKLFAQEGYAPDIAAQTALDFKDYGSDVAFLEALNETGKARKTWREKFYQEEKAVVTEEKQHTAFVRDAKHPGPVNDVILPEDLFPGDEITVAGTKLKVKEFTFDDNGDVSGVTLDDGAKYGTQHVKAGTKLFIDEKSLKQKEPSTEFAPKETVAPKLRSGEKGTGELLQGEDQPFNLSGEKATDGERIAAEKAKAEQVKKEADELAAKQQQEMIGLGGARPYEFQGGSGTPTGIKNATVDVERAKRGLPAAMEPARRSFGEVWDRAMAIIDHDPQVQDSLINELRDHPRALTDVEDALILHRQIDLQNEYGKATRDLAQAFDDGRSEDVIAEKGRVAGLSDQLLDLYNIGKKAGTETGRGLNARKMMANEDFTLANLELQKRAANGGRPLTDTERADLQKTADDYKAKSEAFQQQVAARDQKIADLETAAALERVAKEAAPEVKIHPSIIRIAEKLVKELDIKADGARARIKARMTRTSINVDPTVLLDLAEIGASHLGHKILDFAKWSEKMVEDVGDWVKPHLKTVYDASQSKIDELAGKAEKAQVGAVKRALKGESIEDTKKAVGESVAELNKKGEKDKITWHVQKLARALYRSGITDREAMVDALHEVLKGAIPDITRRETADAFSGYGDFKQLTKDQVTVGLRGMKGELQQIAKLEDMAAGKPPLKTGVERRTPTEEERKLIKLVNDAKNKFQVPVEDPTTQLKSSLDTLKTTLKNRITDLEDRLARKDYSPRPRRELALDSEAARLKAARDRIQKRFQEELIADRLKNRTPWEKIMDWGTKYRRFEVLSSPVVIPKLLSAGLARITSMPLEDVIGGALGKLPGVSEVASRAPLEGAGLNVKAEVGGFVPAFMKGLKDSYDVLKKGHSDLDVLYGRASESYTGEFEYGSKILSFPGRLHGLIKAPVKRVAFERAAERLAEFYSKQGLDLSNDVVKMRIGVEAYKASNRSIFLQDNRIASGVSAMLHRWEQSKRGEPPSVGGKVAATAGRVALPIMRVPANIVAETFQYAFGSISGSARLVTALVKGVDNIKPEQADLIMRELKKGSIGGALLLLGYLSPEAIGGYYQHGKKRDPKDVKAGSIRINGVNIPSYLLHNPLLETLQFGATIRRVSDSYLRKKDTEKQGLPTGLLAATLGLTEEVPFVREQLEIGKLYGPQRGQFLGEQAKSLAVPAIVQKAAEWTDRDKYGNVIQRKPQTVMQHIQSGVPGARETVPAKP